MGISGYFDTEKYAWKVGIIEKSLRILPIFLVWLSVPKINFRTPDLHYWLVFKKTQ